MRKIDFRAFRISSVWAVLFSICMLIGYSTDKYGELRFSFIGIIAFLAICALTCTAIYIALVFGGHRPVWANKSVDREFVPLGFIKSWIILFICWIPVFLAEYPGFFVYDATDEYVEVATRVFTTHHPLIHVLLLGGAVLAGHKVTGDYNVGIALYTLFQMLVMSAVFAWIITLLFEKKDGNRPAKKISYILCFVWYGVFPTIVMFVLCSAKDTLFAAAMMIVVVMTAKLLDIKAELWKQRELWILCIASVLMMLFRHNGMYGFLVYALSLAVVALIDKSEQRKRNVVTVVICTICIVFLYKGLDKGLAIITHADDTEEQEILSVPIQQMARTLSYQGDEVSDEDKEILYEIVPRDAWMRYTPNLSDPVKSEFKSEIYSINKEKYLGVWLKLFKEHPLSYINAWIGTSYGYYYPFTVVNVYEGHEVYTFTYTESSYFGYEVETPGERTSFIPVIDTFYRWLSLDDDIQRIPVISLLFSMAFVFWVYMFCFALCIYRRNYKTILAFTLPMGVWLTLLLGPTYLPRYTTFMWYLLPLIIGMAFRQKDCKE